MLQGHCSSHRRCHIILRGHTCARPFNGCTGNMLSAARWVCTDYNNMYTYMVCICALFKMQ